MKDTEALGESSSVHTPMPPKTDCTFFLRPYHRPKPREDVFSDAVQKRIEKEKKHTIVGLEINMEILAHSDAKVWYREGVILHTGSIAWNAPVEDTIYCSKNRADPTDENEARIRTMRNGTEYDPVFYAPTGIYRRHGKDGCCMQILVIVCAVLRADETWCAENDCELSACHRCFPDPHCSEHGKCVEARSTARLKDFI